LKGDIPEKGERSEQGRGASKMAKWQQRECFDFLIHRLFTSFCRVNQMPVLVDQEYRQQLAFEESETN